MCTNHTFGVLACVSANSEANARRIAFVEQCFGSSGQVVILSLHFLIIMCFSVL